MTNTSKSMLKRHAVQKGEAMTDTPMTSREEAQMHKAWMLYEAKQKQNAGIHGWYVKPTEFYAGYQASQAQQASEIEALKHDLYSYMKASNGYVNEIMKQSQTIAELVEALDFMERHTAIYPSHPKRVSARELIAKVKPSNQRTLPLIKGQP